ncbi:MAG: class I SAM-dependent methyltransferase [Bacteroidetes bacterium]|nr:class I SAM-dependent methyltransferase [Bacteroidota bacterium]
MFRFFIILFFFITFQTNAQKMGDDRWGYKLVKNINPLLEEALKYFKKPGLALDLGAGRGIDTLKLLHEGWKVYAIDSNKLSRKLILQNAKDQDLSQNLHFMLYKFKDIPENLFTKSFDFIYASRSLQYCDPQFFPKFWLLLKNCLKKDGILAIHLIGDNNKEKRNKSVFSLQEVKLLLKDYEILKFIISKNRYHPNHKQIKLPDIYKIIARKIYK